MKIGDLVSVLDEDFKGKIIFLKSNVALVEDEFGFTHEIETKKLIPRNHSIYDEIRIFRKPEAAQNISKKHQQNTITLDLHFEKLIENPNSYEPWERLMIQKERLLESIEYCKRNKVKKLNIVHGIGDGVLQNLVYEILLSTAGIEYEKNDFFFHSSGNVEVIFR